MRPLRTSAASRRRSFHSSMVPSPRPSRISATRSICSSSVSASMKPVISRTTGSLPLSSSTSIISSSAPLEPESGSDAASLTSNSRAFSIKNPTFSAEIASSGIACSSICSPDNARSAGMIHCAGYRKPASSAQETSLRKRRMHWTVGKVKITKIVELETIGSTRFILPLASNEEIRKLPWLTPHFATEEGRLKMSIHSLVVETRSRRIVVDTGLGNDKEGRNVPTWNNRKGPFLETLTEAGFPPDSIDTVLCTHLHVDHVGWNTKLVGGQWIPTFANARYVFGKTEYEYWRDHIDEPDKVAVFNDSVRPIVEAGKADLVASDHRLTVEIILIPTPGHSPGHMSIHIQSDGEQGLLTGDVAHHPCQMAHLDWSSTADSDPVQSAAMRRELFLRFADTPTLVIGGHFNAGYIRRDGDAFKFIV